MPTPSDMAAQLHPPRLPVDFAELTWQDASGAFGVGLLVAILFYLVLRVLLTRKERLSERVARELEQWRTLPGPERHYRQTRLWVELMRLGGAGGNIQPPWSEDLYRPEVQADHDALDGELLVLARKRRG